MRNEVDGLSGVLSFGSRRSGCHCSDGCFGRSMPRDDAKACAGGSRVRKRSEQGDGYQYSEKCCEGEAAGSRNDEAREKTASIERRAFYWIQMRLQAESAINSRSRECVGTCG